MTRSGARPSDALRSASSGESSISTDSTGYIFVLMNKNNFRYLKFNHSSISVNKIFCLWQNYIFVNTCICSKETKEGNDTL